MISARWSATMLVLAIAGSGACLVHAFRGRARGETELLVGARQNADASARLAALAPFTDEAVRLARARAASPRALFAGKRAGLLATLPENWVEVGPEKKNEGPVSVHRSKIPAREWTTLLRDLRLISGHAPEAPIGLQISAEDGAAKEPQLNARLFVEEPLP